MSWMTLKSIRKYTPLARKLKVSKVARSPRGFMTAYVRAKGKVKNLSPYWRNRRNNFVKRHMAQVRKNRERLWKKGKPSRRALALIHWAYMPRS